MADSEIAGLTEDTTPDSTDNIYAQDAAGAVDKRVPLSALPISTATQTALDLKAAAADLTAHIDDTADAHDASAISILDTANDFTATDVEGALAELQADHETDAQNLTDHAADTTSIHGIADTSALETTTGAQTKVDTHVNDAAGAHAATAISADSTTLVGTGTDVQAVLEELDNAIVAAETATSNHLADTSAAHAASAISADSTTLVGVGTDVQAVLEELDNGIADHLADATAAHAASAVSVDSTTLVGTGTDAQAVFEELDNAIVAAETATANHLADTSAAHAASAISADSTTLVGVGTDVQAVLEELDNGIADHLADATAAHAASAISFSPTGNIAATDAQAAIAEVATDLTTYVDNEIIALDEIAAGVRTDLNTGTPGFVSLDVDLANGISGGDTLTGGTGSGEGLTLASTTHATRGTIFVRDPLSLFSEDKTNTTTTPVKIISIPSTTDITLNDTGGGLNAGNYLGVVAFAGTVIYDADSYLFAAAALFENTGSFKNVNGEARTLQGVQALVNAPTFTADGAAVTVSSIGVVDSPICSVANSGTLTVAAMTALSSGVTVNNGATITSLTALSSGATVNNGGTVTTRRGFLFSDSTGTGTVTTAVGVDIAALSKAGTSIGIRNASTFVGTPSVATLSAASSAITPNATVKRLNNTSGGSLTLTSAPTVTDGQDGQILVLFNSSAQNVVIQDQGTLASSNLRLSATTITLGTRDSIMLMYSSDIGDWIQIGQVNVT